MSINYEHEFASFFDTLADAARTITLKYFRKPFILNEKEDKSPVTQADREIEQALRGLIAKKFPKHGVIGEEFGSQNAKAEFVWIIDPIDGTKAFATGRPSFGTIIGLAHEGKPMVGLIDQAYTQERWFGVTSRLCRHNGVAVKVAEPRQLAQARFYTTTPAMFDGGFEASFDALRKNVKWAQFSGDCYAYGLLASGWIDLICERQLKIHDVTGVIPIVTGAGGFTSDWNGREIGLDFDGMIVAASSKTLAMESLVLIQEAKARNLG